MAHPEETPIVAAPTPEDAAASALLDTARAAANGDTAATTALLRAVGPRVSRVVRTVLGPGHPDVDDATQQALIAFVQALPAFRGDSNPARYASTIAVRTALALRKRVRRDRSRQEPDCEPDQLQDSAHGPKDELVAQRRKALLRSLLDELVPDQAEALAMRVVLGWSLEEIAAESGAPLNTVRSRLRLAKESLRKSIERDPRLVEALGGMP